MKKYFMLAAVSSLFLASCNNEMDTVLPEAGNGLQTRSMVDDNMDFQIINYEGESCVQFSNDSVFIETLMKLRNMSSEEIQTLFSGNGFVNQIQLMEEAMQEQEQIVDDFEKDLTQPYPHQQIEDFKSKYQDVFLFNPYDSTDFIPNYKVSFVSKAFVSRKGIFLIGDSVVYVPTRTEEDVFGPSISTYGDNEATNENSINHAETKYQIPDGDYVKVRAKPEMVKVFFEGGVYRMIVGMELISQKKKSIFWRAHHADVYLDYELTTPALPYTTIVPKNEYTHVYDKINKEDHIIAEIPPINTPGLGTPPEFSLNGSLEIWSNEIPEDHKGKSTVRIR